MITILILAAIGLIINIAGRLFIVLEDKSLEGRVRLAVTCCPGAELLYLMVRWERARFGAGLCALSLALLMPLLGQVSILSQQPAKGTSLPAGWAASFKSLFKEEALPSRAEGGKSDPQVALRAKADEVDELRLYLVEWYGVLMRQEPFLCDEMPDETEEFNRAAAAYHRLLTVSKLEAAEVDHLWAKLGLSGPSPTTPGPVLASHRVGEVLPLGGRSHPTR